MSTAWLRRASVTRRPNAQSCGPRSLPLALGGGRTHTAKPKATAEGEGQGPTLLRTRGQGAARRSTTLRPSLGPQVED